MNNYGKTSFMEILFILSMFIPTVLMGVFGAWPLFWVFLIFSLIFGTVEIVYVRTTGKTVSQHFWAFSKTNRVKAIVVLGSMLLMWLALIFHLGYKMFQ